MSVLSVSVLTMVDVYASQLNCLNKENMHIKLCFVVLKAWVEKQYKLSNLVSLSAGLGQRRSINKQNGGLGFLVFGCPLTSFALRTLGLFEFIFLNN